MAWSVAQERQLWGCFCCVNAPRAGPSPARWYCYSYGQFSAFKFCKTILRKISPWRCWLSSRLEIAFPCLKFLTEFQMENVQLHFPSRAAVTHFNNRGCATPQRWPRASILKRTRWSGCGEGLDGGAGAERAVEEKEPRLQPSSRRVPCGPFASRALLSPLRGGRSLWVNFHPPGGRGDELPAVSSTPGDGTPLLWTGSDPFAALQHP